MAKLKEIVLTPGEPQVCVVCRPVSTSWRGPPWPVLHGGFSELALPSPQRPLQATKSCSVC